MGKHAGQEFRQFLILSHMQIENVMLEKAVSDDIQHMTLKNKYGLINFVSRDGKKSRTRMGIPLMLSMNFLC